MVKIIWTEASLLDLNEIAEYIALDKVSAAEKLVRKVFDRIELLSDSPNSGRKPPELGKTRYREVIVGPCRIFYRANKDEIVILYIMRGERLLKNYILGDRELKGN
ncbi:MAG: type II toxin-antitoxin system RelE/ParE family toxin [Arenicella sp.]|nr:type II toxin-antitoxin system RelE/ParE family toxin [Arenicella sp.]